MKSYKTNAIENEIKLKCAFGDLLTKDRQQENRQFIIIISWSVSTLFLLNPLPKSLKYFVKINQGYITVC